MVGLRKSQLLSEARLRRKIRRTDQSSAINELQVKDYGLIEFITNRPMDRQAELIKFVYTLDSQGQKPTPEILAGFYQAF
jgi:hypothetical protein